MPSFRQIHTKIWKDAWFLDLEAQDKLLFIYLFSNERSNLSGLYDISLKVIAFETDIPVEEVRAGLARFERAGKAFYQDGWLWIPKLLRYNAQNITSPNIQTHLRSCLSEIPDIPLKAQWIAYYNDLVEPAYRMDTPSSPMDTPQGHTDTAPYQYKEQEQEQEQEQELITMGATAPAPDGAPLPPASAPDLPEPKPERPPPRASPLTEGLRGFLDCFGAQRFKNNIQKEAIACLEREHGTARLVEVARWCAKRGMSVSDAVIATESAIPKWGEKDNGRGAKVRGSPQKKGETNDRPAYLDIEHFLDSAN